MKKIYLCFRFLLFVLILSSCYSQPRLQTVVDTTTPFGTSTPEKAPTPYLATPYPAKTIPPTEAPAPATTTESGITKDSFPVIPLEGLELKNCTTIDKGQLPNYSEWFDRFIAGPFDPNQVIVKPLNAYINQAGIPIPHTTIEYDPHSTPTFPDSKSKPYQFDNPSAICVRSGVFDYLAWTIPFFNPDAPNNRVNLTAGIVVRSTNPKGETWEMPKPDLDKTIKQIILGSPTFVYLSCYNGDLTRLDGTPIHPDTLTCNTVANRQDIPELMKKFYETGIAPVGLKGVFLLGTPPTLK